ncbi:MAG: hypothetical protein GX651_05630, partial [Methanomicrobiales archaeon]|nr:hypothetical protein [Methanomicrobiales archaeon]
MRDFFSKIFGKKEPETLIIAFASVPALLDEREHSARSALKDQTSQPVQEIRNGIARLQLIVSTIAGAEHEPEIHPKLKSIAKNTLPQFIRAMNTALSRELPSDDIEAFYPAIVECVKNCLNSINGPGRYLRIVFPDEMKASRAGVDAIGHEINTITAVLASYRKEMGAVTRAREQYGTIQGNTQAIAVATEKEMRARQRIAEITGRLDEIAGELAGLPSDPEMADAENKKDHLHTLQTRHAELSRIYAARTMTMAHVLRKAEKIATRKKDGPEIAVLKEAMSLLSDHELPEGSRLNSALAAAFPVAGRMIEAGEIALKNKDERGIFSDPEAFMAEISRTCSELRALEDDCRHAQQVIDAHPLLVRVASLERERTQLEVMLDKEHQVQQELLAWQQKTTEGIPVLRESVKKELEAIIGRAVQ